MSEDTACLGLYKLRKRQASFALRGFAVPAWLSRRSGHLSVRAVYLHKPSEKRDRQVPPPGGFPSLVFICSAVRDSITNLTRSGHGSLRSPPFAQLHFCVRRRQPQKFASLRAMLLVVSPALGRLASSSPRTLRG